ncbi:MAG: hypothetical protein JNL67_03560 [Planctomycetaceae bacterium]|nr:hypothetical protein [Planctomycetaceae bacterium]
MTARHDSADDRETNGTDRPNARPQLIKKAPAPPRQWRPMRWLAFGLLGLGVLVGLAPTIISKTALGDWLLGQAVPTAWGTVEIGRRDLGWFSPISIGELRLKNPQGELLAEVGSLKTKETLWQIISTAAVTEMTVDQAAVRIEWRADGSNWEDWIAAVLPKESQPTSERATPDLTIHFNNCQVVLDSKPDAQTWLAEQLQGQVSVQKNAKHILIQANTHLKDADQNLAAGKVDATLLIADQEGLASARDQWQLTGGDPQKFKVHTTTGGLAFMVKLDETAVSVGRSVLRRFLPTIEMSGLATGQVVGISNWYGDYVHVSTPKVVVSRLLMSDDGYLSGDQLRLQQVETVGGVQWSPDRIRFQQLKLNADYLRSEVDGELAFDEVLHAINTRRLPTTTVSSAGAVNVAMLANQLPRTLNLHEGLQLEQGDLTWQVFNREEGDGSQRLFVDVIAKNLAGRRPGGVVRLEQPIQINGSLRDYNRPVTFDQLEFRSDFLQASALPQTDGGTQIRFEMNFDQLRAALEQFVKLPQMELAGRAGGVATWKMLTATGEPASLVAPASGMQITSTVGLTNAHVVIPNLFEIREPNMSLEANTTMFWGNPQTESLGLMALLSPEADVTIQSGRVDLRTVRPAAVGAAVPAPAAAGMNPDALGLLVELKQPVHLPQLNRIVQYITGTLKPPVNPAQVPVFVADVEVAGPLEQWLAMLRPLMTGVDIAMAGASQAKFTVALNEQFALINQLNGNSRGFEFRGNGVILREPRVEMAGAASYHYNNGLIHTEDFLLAGTSLAAKATKTRLQFSPLKNRMEGEIVLHGDLARIWETYRLMQVAAAEDAAKKLGHAPLNMKPLPPMATPPVFEQIQLVGYTEPVPVGESTPTGSATAPLAIPATATGAAAPLGMGGDLVAKITLKSEDFGPINVDVASEITKGWIGSQQPNGAWVAWLKEPKVVANGQATLAPDFSSVELPNVYVEAEKIRGVTTGRIMDLKGNPELDLRGRVEAVAMEWLRQFAGPEIGDLEVSGLTDHIFEVQGPPTLQGLRGKWISSWQNIRWMGLQSGPADLVIQLADGIAKLVPLRFPAGGGQIHLAPEVDMRNDPMWVRLPRGVIFDQVKLTPQLCRNFLKYSAPLLAEVTSVEGSFSLDSDGVEVPLSDWTKLVAKARVTINGARVGPGPLGIQIGNIASTVRAVADGQSLDAAGLQALGLGQFAGLVPSGDGQRTQALTDLATNVLGSLQQGQRPDLNNLLAGNSNTGNANTEGNNASAAPAESNVTWLEIPAQTMSVNLQDGVVVHDRLSLNVRGFELVSQGRVGLDQSMALQTQLNLPAELMQKNPQIAAALGNSIVLPISGTLTQPQIQAGQLKTALNTALANGLQQALGSELEKRLGAGGSSGGGDPVQNLLQQGQQKLEQKLQDKLNLPPGILSPGNLNPGGFNPGNLLPGLLPNGNGAAPNGTLPNGTAPNGTLPNGTAPNGSLPPAGPATAPTLSPGSNPLAPPTQGLPRLPTANDAEDAVNRLLNRGRQKLLGGDK